MCQPSVATGSHIRMVPDGFMILAISASRSMEWERSEGGRTPDSTASKEDSGWPAAEKDILNRVERLLQRMKKNEEVAITCQRVCKQGRDERYSGYETSWSPKGV